MHSKYVPQCSIVVGSDEKVKEFIYLGWMDSKDMSRHGHRNHVVNKIRVEGICHDKRSAQGRAG